MGAIFNATTISHITFCDATADTGVLPTATFWHPRSSDTRLEKLWPPRETWGCTSPRLLVCSRGLDMRRHFLTGNGWRTMHGYQSRGWTHVLTLGSKLRKLLTNDGCWQCASIPCEAWGITIWGSHENTRGLWSINSVVCAFASLWECKFEDNNENKVLTFKKSKII